MYNRFISAFEDENDTPLSEIFGEASKMQDTTDGQIDGLKVANNRKELNENKKETLFQRWIVYYLKVPFENWRTKNNEQVNYHAEEETVEDEDEEENYELDFSFPILGAYKTDNEDDNSDDDSSQIDGKQKPSQVLSSDIFFYECRCLIGFIITRKTVNFGQLDQLKTSKMLIKRLSLSVQKSRNRIQHLSTLFLFFLLYYHSNRQLKYKLCQLFLS